MTPEQKEIHAKLLYLLMLSAEHIVLAGTLLEYYKLLKKVDAKDDLCD